MTGRTWLMIGIVLAVLIAITTGLDFMIAAAIAFWLTIISMAVVGAMRMGAEDAERMSKGEPPKWPPFIKRK